jgi:hypothetical protein
VVIHYIQGRVSLKQDVPGGAASQPAPDDSDDQASGGGGLSFAFLFAVLVGLSAGPASAQEPRVQRATAQIGLINISPRPQGPQGNYVPTDPALLAVLQQLAQQNQQLLALLASQKNAPAPLIVLGAPYQQLPIAGAPRQDLPIQGAPRQDLPIQGAPKQDVPIQGQPRQDLPIQAAPKQQLPVSPGEAKPMSEPAPTQEPVRGFQRYTLYRPHGR